MTMGYKTGGRTKGTPNKRTIAVIEKLAALGCDPIEGMAHIAMDTANPAELRGRMYAELAGYVAPKRKAIDVSSEDGTAASGVHEIVVRVVRPQPCADDVADGTSLHQVEQHRVRN